MKRILSVLLCSALCISLVSCTPMKNLSVQKTLEYYSLDTLPEYSGKPYVALNGNIPNLTISQKDYTSYEEYSPLDFLGRCGECIASIGHDIMPTEKRQSIGSIKPTGWQTAKYDFVDGKYLYNRCHLIGFQLTGENANECNLITGTRSMNTQGMLPFENMVADYVKETNNHVLYRVTPVYEGDNLLASGVIMEALSVEDKGAGISFNIYCFNREPGVLIDYKTGNNRLDEAYKEDFSQNLGEYDFVINIASDKFHLPHCSGVTSMKATNKEEFRGTRKELIQKGYKPCGSCKP
ncbi:MAG: DNA/RNA non-specific endonuclease [Clostridia bacterium]|nr:DNA/RNA non-specific endonuclease [Clostridia bacterium]